MRDLQLWGMGGAPGGTADFLEGDPLLFAGEASLERAFWGLLRRLLKSLPHFPFCRGELPSGPVPRELSW